MEDDAKSISFLLKKDYFRENYPNHMQLVGYIFQVMARTQQNG